MGLPPTDPPNSLPAQAKSRATAHSHLRRLEEETRLICLLPEKHLYESTHHSERLWDFSLDKVEGALNIVIENPLPSPKTNAYIDIGGTADHRFIWEEWEEKTIDELVAQLKTECKLPSELTYSVIYCGRLAAEDVVLPSNTLLGSIDKKECLDRKATTNRHHQFRLSAVEDSPPVVHEDSEFRLISGSCLRCDTKTTDDSFAQIEDALKARYWGLRNRSLTFVIDGTLYTGDSKESYSSVANNKIVLIVIDGIPK